MSTTISTPRRTKVHPADLDTPSRTPSPPAYATHTPSFQSTKSALLLSARSFLAFSEHKLLTTLSAPASRSSYTGRQRDAGHVLRRAVVIQNAMDEVEGFVRVVAATVEEVAPMPQLATPGIKAPLPRRASERDVRKLFEIAEEDEDEEEHDHLETASTSSTSESEWFEQTWSTLDHSDYSDEEGATADADGAAVQVVAVGEDDELDLEVEHYAQPELLRAERTYDARQEIYLAMPPSPRLGPTVIRDKMEGDRYVSPEPVPPALQPAPATAFEEDIDACPDAASDCGSETEEDDGLPVTPTQDVVDDFGSTTAIKPFEANTHRKDTGLFNHNENDFEEDHEGCRDCPGCMGEGFGVRDDEVIF